MSYRALYVADVHLSNTLPFAERDPQTLITDRLRDVLQVLEQMRVYADQHEITDVWIIGDLLDKRLLDAITLKMAVEAVNELNQRHRVVLVPGNHEAGDAACRHYVLDGFAQLADVAVIGNEGQWYDTINGPRVYAMPFLPQARATDVLRKLIDSGERPDLLLLHQTIRGGRVGGWEAKDGLDPELLAAVSPTVLSGHFHTPQQVGETITYLGAPVQHHFQDVDESRGFWDISLGDEIQAEMVAIDGAPRFHVVPWITSGQPPVIDVSPGDYVKLLVQGPKSAVDKLMPQARLLCESLKTDKGARYAKPISEPDSGPTRQRIIETKPGERPSAEVIVGRYLDVADCTGLNRETLAAFAKELVHDAEQ